MAISVNYFVGAALDFLVLSTVFMLLYQTKLVHIRLSVMRDSLYEPVVRTLIMAREQMPLPDNRNGNLPNQSRRI